MANHVHLVLAASCHQLKLYTDGMCPYEKDSDVFEGLVHAVEESERSGFQGEAMISVGINSFEETCIYSGAQLSVIGRERAKSYSTDLESQFIPRTFSRIYRFGNKTFPGIGNMHTRISVTNNFIINVTPEIVDSNVFLFLGLDLDLLNHLNALVDFEENWISSRHDNWCVPINRNKEQLYVDWHRVFLYIGQKLRKIHQHFHHPQAERFVFVIRRAALEDFSLNLNADLDNYEEYAQCVMRQQKLNAFASVYRKKIVYLAVWFCWI